MPDCITRAELDFRNAVRKLWEEHVVWTRMYIVSFASDLRDADQIFARLMKNQEDIGNAIKPFYGEAVRNVLTELLKNHIQIAVNVLLAVKCRDKPGLESANKQWFQNADEIAAFLASANPCWDEQELKVMLYDHLRLTAEEAVARLNGNYAADIAAFDGVHEQVLCMADLLAEGVIKQFPDRFG